MHGFDLAEIIKPSLRIAVCALVGLASVTRTHAACTARVLSEVEVGEGGFFLSDLLASGSCPQLATEAAKVRLGSVPRAGSARVLEGSEARSLLERLLGAFDEGVEIEVPQRIRVRRSGQRASCAEIEGRLFPGAGSGGPNGARANQSIAGKDTREIVCGATIPSGTPVEITESRWDPGLGSWALRARCRRREDCVPFLIQVRSPELPAPVISSRGEQSASPRQRMLPRSGLSSNRPSLPTLVRRGQSASLVWDQQGIRLVVPSVSLDAGNPGDTVRARIARSGRIVHATVTGAGWLRMAS